MNQGGKIEGELLDVESLELSQILQIIIAKKWIVISFSVVFSVFGFAFAKYLPNVYRSTALLAPAEESQGGGLSAMASQLGGIASLAGVNLSAGQIDKARLAMEVLKSRVFLTSFINRRNILVPLMASKRWDQNSRKLVYDSDIYDFENKNWVRIVDPPLQPKPSDWEAYRQLSKILQISRNAETGLITVSVDHYSPELAAIWVDWLIEDLNEHMRRLDIGEAEKSVSYLQEQLTKTSLAEMQKVFYQLIEKQTQTFMLANVRKEYAFKTVDPAVAPEEKYGPKRMLIISTAVILGFFVGIFFILSIHLLSGRRDLVKYA